MKQALLWCLLFSHCGFSFTQGEHFFNDTLLHEIRLVSLHSSDWDSLVARYEREEYTPMRITLDGITMDSVGVRIKGNNFLNYQDKGKFQAYKVDFNAFVKGQKFDGLKKINLNNREKLANHLAYKLCRDNGIIAPRSSFSKVYFNDTLIGNYLNLEQIDVTFLKQHYGYKDGNLYSASGKGAVLEYKGPDPSEYFYAYEKKTNTTENDYSDLLRTLYFFSNSNERNFEDSIDQYIDFTPFLQSVVIEMTLCKRDAYYDAGRNFYLYYDTDRKRFIYIPDDFDYSFSDEFSFDLNFLNDQSPHLGDVSNLFIDRFLRSENLRNRYYSQVCQFINSDFEPGRLNGYIDKVIAFGLRNNFDFEDFCMRTTEEIRNFISKRKTLLASDFQTSNYSCTAGSLPETNPVPDAPVVYPNPFSETLRIAVSDATNRYQVTVSDLTGKTWYNADQLSGNQDLDLEPLPPGIYTLKISTGLVVRFFKVIKL